MSFVGTADYLCNILLYKLSNICLYLAPEVIVGTGHGKPTDWWGLGILMYVYIYIHIL